MFGAPCRGTALVGIGILLAGVAACDGPVSGARFVNGEALSHPGTASIELSLIPAEPAELYVEYGAAGGSLSHRTPATRVASESTARFRLEGLEAGRHYRYRVRSRPDGATGRFDARAEHAFVTLRAPGDPVRFGFSTDSHVYLSWALAHCMGFPDELVPFEGTLENIRRSGLDFLIVGGDEAQTHCLACPECRVDGESSGANTVRSGREALLRYRIMRRAYEALAADVPIFQVLGNHDGEAGFGSADNRCGHLADTAELSSQARLAHFPVSESGVNGHPDGRYYAFESGDALFVVLDVMGYTRDLPRRVEDWTLGQEQLLWLERTLAGSKRRWKFLFAHHLVGGSELELCYVYGRGGIRSTDDGTVAGRFRGEQARIHLLMRQYRAQVFFSGHDHVFAAGEKDGVLYVVGGQAAGPEEPFWTSDPAFNSAYDYDQDGSPDYLTDKGFVRVTVEGPQRATIEYVKSDLNDAAENGRVLFETALDPGPPP